MLSVVVRSQFVVLIVWCEEGWIVQEGFRCTLCPSRLAVSQRIMSMNRSVPGVILGEKDLRPANFRTLGTNLSQKVSMWYFFSWMG